MWERKEIVTLPPLYIRAPGLIYLTSLVVIHKGIEVVIIRVGPIVSALSIWLGKGVNWTVIDHMSQGVTSSTDSKVANIVRVSPSVTEITLGRQTMMCSMAQCWFPAGRTDVHGAGKPVVTEIWANVATSGGGAGARMLDKDLRRGGGDPLPFCYASRQTYIKVNDTYSEGGTHEETLCPQSKARVMNKRQGDRVTIRWIADS